MAEHLTDIDIELITNIIDDWDLGIKFTWKNLRAKVKKKLGIYPTRQAMEKKARIKDAYDALKESIRTNGKVKKPRRFSSLRVAEIAVNGLEIKNESLNRENRNLLEQFRRWQYNAYSFGMTEDQLDAPLPPMLRK